MDYITNIDNIPEKIAISSPFIIYVSILLFGILNQQLEMSATFMFGVLFLYSIVSLFQMFYNVEKNHVHLNPNECQFFDQHLFYQSYQSPSFPSSFLCFVFFSIFVTICTSTFLNLPLIILAVCVAFIIALRMRYNARCFTSNLRLKDAGISILIGGFVATIYYYLIIYTFMNMKDYMLFFRPKSNQKQCVNITNSTDSSPDDV